MNENEKKVRVKKFSYIDQYRERLEQLAKIGLNYTSITKIIRNETGISVPYNSIKGYMQRNKINILKIINQKSDDFS
jgi:hypothetical protein